MALRPRTGPRGACRRPKGRHDHVCCGPVVRTGAPVVEGQSAVPTEYEVAPHLCDIQLLRVPHLALESETDVLPDHSRWRHGSESLPLQAETPIAPALGVSKP